MFKDAYGKINKDFIFKILFAVEIACLPLIISAKILMPDWAMSIFVGIIIATKLAMVFLKNPADNKQLYLDAGGNVGVITFCLITYCCYGYLNVVITVLASVLFALEELAKVYFFYKPNNQIIDSLNFSAEMFMFIILSALLFVFVNTILLKIAAIALIVTCLALVAIQGYKFVYYYIIKKNKRKKY